MKTINYFLVTLFMIIAACSQPKQVENQKFQNSLDEEALLKGEYKVRNPRISQSLIDSIRNIGCPTPTWDCSIPIPNTNGFKNRPIAFSYTGFNHEAGPYQYSPNGNLGDPELTYHHPITIEPEINGYQPLYFNKFFVAPCDGLYYFTISFVNNAYPPATYDDVEIYFAFSRDCGKTWTDGRPRTEGGFTGIGSAWAGQHDCSSKKDGGPICLGNRTTGSYSVIYRLNKGEAIGTFSHADTPANGDSPKRIIPYFNWSGYRISD